MQNRLYRKFGLCWEIKEGSRYDPYEDRYIAKPLCPKNNCRCEILDVSEMWAGRISKFKCKCSNSECGFELDLDEEVEKKGKRLIIILQGKEYDNFELVDLDGELIPINERKKIEDEDYWVDAKISQNKKGEKQLMVLAGSKKSKDKTQLFLDSSHEKLGFDQNDTHPRDIFAQVHATFKNSSSELSSKKENDI